MTQIRSHSKTLDFGPGLPTALIGERINPIGKKGVQECVLRGDLAWLDDLALEQQKAGANIL